MVYNTIELKRSYVASRYESEKWRIKVHNMPDFQIESLFKKFRNKEISNYAKEVNEKYSRR